MFVSYFNNYFGTTPLIIGICLIHNKTNIVPKFTIADL
jgi:hypothetical protein